MNSGQCFHLHNILDESIARPQIIDVVETTIRCFAIIQLGVSFLRLFDGS